MRCRRALFFNHAPQPCTSRPPTLCPTRCRYDHYEDKVKGLRDARRARIAKGKTESDRDAGKLKRNEDKLAEAKAAFYDSRTTVRLLGVPAPLRAREC